MKIQKSISEIAVYLKAELTGDDSITITGIAPLGLAKEGDISFLDNPAYRKSLPNTRASAVIVAPSDASACPVTALITDKPYLAYAKVAALFDDRKMPPAGIHTTAVVDPTAKLGKDIHIGPHVVIGARVVIENNVIIEAGCVIAEDCIIGSGTRLYPNVTLYHKIVLGQRCVIHSGVVIGADGFGIAKDEGVWHRVAQLGTVIIGNDVDVGANTTIDRGAISNTMIGDGVKLDNQIQVGHNVKIGDHTAVAGCSALAGSSTIGKHCIIGGAAAVNGHIELCDNVSLSAMSGVRHSIYKSGVYGGAIGAVDHLQWRKTEARLRQLNELAHRVRRLEKQLSELTQTETTDPQ